VLYFRPHGEHTRKFYLNNCDGFSQEKHQAKVFRTRQEWEVAYREMAKSKIFLNVDPVGWEPDVVEN